MNKKTGAFILAVLMAGMLAACGQNEDAKTGEEGIVENDSAGEQKNEDADGEPKGEDLPTAEDDTGETSTAEDAAGGTSITEKDTNFPPMPLATPCRPALPAPPAAAPPPSITPSPPRRDRAAPSLPVGR